jgi:hypothetical protein
MYPQKQKGHRQCKERNAEQRNKTPHHKLRERRYLDLHKHLPRSVQPEIPVSKEVDAITNISLSAIPRHLP